VYDFTLAPLVLHAVFTGDATPLRRWLDARPPNAVTVLDTHDGLGMIDAGPGDLGDGLLTTPQIEAVVARIDDNSYGTSVASYVPGGVYQVSCTLYDALGRDDRAFLLARVLQLFVPGTPQVYYVGLLAGRNAEFGGDAREINRRRYTRAEVDEAVRQPPVARLLELVRLRGTHPAFEGAFSLHDAPDGELALAWRHGTASAELRVTLPHGRWRVSLDDGAERWAFADTDVVP